MVIHITLTFPVRSPMPMIIATGIVIAIVKTPHGLFASAWTTTSASTAIRMIMIASTLMSASAPTPRPISSFTICPSVLPRRRRSEKHNHVVHAAAESCADQDPKRAGQKTELRRQHRADQRPRPRDRREMMAENHPTICRDKIFAIFCATAGVARSSFRTRTLVASHLL